MPRAARAGRGSRARSAPSNLPAPPLAGRCPMTVRIRLVLPAPLRPTRPTMLPRCTSSEKPRSAWTDAMVTCNDSIFSIAAAPGHVAPPLGVGEPHARRAVGQNAAAVERHDAACVARDDLHVV